MGIISKPECSIRFRRRLRVFGGFCLLCVLCAWALAAPAPRPRTIYGFTARTSAGERSLERRFLLLPSPGNARDAHAFLTAEPHVAGSPRDRVLAEWVRDRWREYGLERVDITEHVVLLPYATEGSVQMTEPSAWRASLKEEPVAGDPSTLRDVGLPYHAYSASGDVTAPVVYAGSGSHAGYEWISATG